MDAVQTGKLGTVKDLACISMDWVTIIPDRELSAG
jgi:hypothetical protein